MKYSSWALELHSTKREKNISSNMQNYINQLIKDLRKASWNVRPPRDIWDHADPDYEVELEDLSFVEKFVYGEEEPVSQITGIDAMLLPPPEKLTDDQKALLSVELEKLLLNHHFVLEFPERFPFHLRYPFIREFWNDQHVALSFGNNHIEFCDYEEEDCPFPGYCNTCKEIDQQMKHDEEILKQRGIDDVLDDDELPF